MGRLVRLADLKSRLNIPANDAASDAQLLAAIDAATALCEQWCGRRFGYTGVDLLEQFDGEEVGRGPLLLSTFPVVRPAGHTLQLKERWQGVTYDTVTALVEDSDYVVREARGVIWPWPDQRCWEPGRQNIRVTYRGGYLGPDDAAVSGVIVVPAHVREAIEMQAAEHFKRRRNPGSQSETYPGNVSAVTFGVLRLLPAAEQMLKRERRTA